MDPVAQPTTPTLGAANGATSTQGADANSDSAIQELVNQGTQQVFGILLSLVMSQTGEG